MDAGRLRSKWRMLEEVASTSKAAEAKELNRKTQKLEGERPSYGEYSAL